MLPLLAHSSPKNRPDEPPQTYSDHVTAVREGALQRAQRMLKFSSRSHIEFFQAIKCAAHWHDLGKLDEGNQTALRKGRSEPLPIDHIDAGVAHTLEHCEMAAWLIRAHHSPGLPRESQEILRNRPFRGKRNREADPKEHDKLIQHVDDQLPTLIRLQTDDCGDQQGTKKGILHGLPMRLALSCLVDADHNDTANYDRGCVLNDAPDPKWQDRLDLLDSYVADLSATSTDHPERVALRTQFYKQCRNVTVDSQMTSCTGPVGIGKTTAVLAFLLKTAIDKKLDRIFIVAPFTNIIDQTVESVRKAIVLPGEDSETVVAAHHHQAEYEHIESREFAAQWTSPIIVTTAVQFFGTLAAKRPGALRKLNSVPRSAVFIDEAHAAIPVRLWPQNWLWLCELCEDWQCHFVFASGSLIDFWNIRRIHGNKSVEVPAIDDVVIENANRYEKQRIRYQMLPHALSRQEFIKAIKDSDKPTLAILNTVQSAAAIAMELRESGEEVLHISTSLCPRDRLVIIEKIKQRLKSESNNWILVATSCVEAGVDFSFQTAFREASSATSTIQVGGRVNRHGERKQGQVIVFHLFKDELINEHPGFKLSAAILVKLFSKGVFDEWSPSKIAGKAMREELKQLGNNSTDLLIKAEDQHNYPEVAKLGRVIDTETRTVVVCETMIQRLKRGERPNFKEVQSVSVQMWARKIDTIRLSTAKSFPDIYLWEQQYDAEFLGYMKGIISEKQISKQGYAII